MTEVARDLGIARASAAPFHLGLVMSTLVAATLLILALVARRAR